MAKLSVRLEGNKSVGDTLAIQAIKNRRRVALAARKATEEMRDRIVTAGKQDMAEGGNFSSPRWQNSLHGVISPEGVETANLTLSIRHRVFFWKVFEYGAKILGRPLLWIPLSWNPTKVSARDFPGKLFRVDREGKNPLLMTTRGGKATAMYVGVKSVRLRRRFHLRPIIRRVSKQMPFIFRKWMRIARKQV